MMRSRRDKFLERAPVLRLSAPVAAPSARRARRAAGSPAAHRPPSAESPRIRASRSPVPEGQVSEQVKVTVDLSHSARAQRGHDLV